MKNNNKRLSVIMVVLLFIIILLVITVVLFATNVISLNANKNINENQNIKDSNTQNMANSNTENTIDSNIQNNTNPDTENTIDYNTQNSINPNTQNTINENNTKYNINDYISYDNLVGSESTAGSNVKYIKFKNINEGLTYRFAMQQEDFCYQVYWHNFEQGVDEIYKSDVNVEINDDILSAYFKGITIYSEGPGSDKDNYTTYSTNIDLKSSTLKTTDEMLSKYNITKTKLITDILNDLVNNLTTEVLLKSTNGDVSSEKITITDFKRNINQYVSLLNNRVDEIAVLYVKSGKLNCDYKDREVLALLGLGNHMGVGLVDNVVTIIL